MSALTQETGHNTPARPEGIRPPRRNGQPVGDLDAFLQSLPDFGKDAARMRDVIMEDRAERRAAAERPGG